VIFSLKKLIDGARFEDIESKGALTVLIPRKLEVPIRMHAFSESIQVALLP
jgi:hypothetical protein